MRLLLIRLGVLFVHTGNWFVRTGIVLQAAGFKLEAAPAARQSWKWRAPTMNELDRARAQCELAGLPHLKICRGPSKGCNDSPPDACADCYVVAWHDRRPSAEILLALERGDA